MPVLKVNEEIRRIYLPSTSELPPDNPEVAWADIAVGPVLGRDIEEVRSDNVMTAAYVLLEARIRDWNYTDEGGEKSIISLDNIRLMRSTDIMFLVNEIRKSDAEISTDSQLTTEEKKTSSSTLVTPVTVKTQE